MSDPDTLILDYFEHRSNLLTQRQKDGILTYPHKFQTDITAAEFLKRFDSVAAGTSDESSEVSMAGRIMSVRTCGSKLVFYDFRSDGHKVQVWLNAKYYTGDFDEISTIVARGDIVGVTGFPARTKRNEMSIVPRNMVLLAPCLKNMPSAHNELSSKEVRFRQRHLDMIINHDDVRPIFETRTAIIKHIRSYFDSRGFLEVETPMLNTIVGGAAARPFATHMNSLNLDVYMRISPELYLKKLIVGGFEKVYEIGRQMRNEDIDMTHNPEFTSIEMYEAYADVNDLIKMTEELLHSLVLKIKGTEKFTVKPLSSEKSEDVEVDFSPPFRRVSMVSELEKILGVTFPRPLNSDECNQFLVKICQDRQIECNPPTTTARLLDTLVGEYIEPTCISPTFICDHPQLMSPLAKWHRHDPELTERFELFINGKEICNAYTELNDPHIQRKCFDDQLKDRETGDDEAQLIDHTFIDALDHGLPPTGGWGMGIDRLCMILTGQTSIKEVLLFPMLRPLKHT
jgi:lysyl-tRNA synthetase class 2